MGRGKVEEDSALSCSRVAVRRVEAARRVATWLHERDAGQSAARRVDGGGCWVGEEEGLMVDRLKGRRTRKRLKYYWQVRWK